MTGKSLGVHPHGHAAECDLVAIDLLAVGHETPGPKGTELVSQHVAGGHEGSRGQELWGATCGDGRDVRQTRSGCNRNKKLAVQFVDREMRVIERDIGVCCGELRFDRGLQLTRKAPDP